MTMTAMSGSSSDSVYSAQGEFVNKLKKLAVKYELCIFIVAHPRKTIGEHGDEKKIRMAK